MTAFSEATSYIRKRFDDNFNVTNVYKVFENNSFEPPTDGKKSFVYLEVLPGNSFQQSLGSTTLRKYRHIGLIQVHIFTPVNTGTGKAMEYADSIAAIFRGVEFNGVICRDVSIGQGEKSDDDGNWWRTTISITFQYDKNF